MNAHNAERMVVLQSVPTPGPTTNPYVSALLRTLQECPEVTVHTFTWRRALLGSYDVFHVHWPDLLMLGRSPLRAFARRLFLAVLLLRLTLRGTTVVRTLHNLHPRNRISRAQKLLLAWLDRLTTWVILLNTSAVSTIDAPTSTILHGHYRDWYSVHALPDPMPGRLTYFGLIRPYKGVERLLDAFRQLPGDLHTLVVAGRPVDADLGQRVREFAARDQRVELRLGFLSDAELVRVVGEAELIVLPYLDMYNSGSALAALSLNRPILVPKNGVNTRLAAEVGAGWVSQFEGDLRPEDLLAALQSVQSSERAPQPDLSQRDWGRAGEEHVTVYRRARRRKSTRVHSRSSP